MAVTTKKDPSTSSALVEVMRRTLASALDPNTWEIHGDEAVIVHHLGFRKALTEYFGTTFLDPRLQWYYDGGVSLHLRMYSGPASMFTKTTIVRLAQSLRAALTENAALWGIAVIANPRGGNGASILRITLRRTRREREQPEVVCEEAMTALGAILQPVEITITKWLNGEADALFDTDPVINEKAADGVRPYVNTDAEWAMIF